MKTQVTSGRTILLFLNIPHLLYNDVKPRSIPPPDFSQVDGNPRQANRSDTKIDRAHEENKEEEYDLGGAMSEPVSDIKPRKSRSADVYTPVRSLSTMNQDWMIKVRLIKKRPVKEWNNARGSGRLQTVEFMDHLEGMIEATMFNEDIDRWDPILTEEKCYLISKAQVKVANRKWTSIDNDVCLSFSKYTEIKPVEDDRKIKVQGYKAKPLAFLARLEQPSSSDIRVIIVGTGSVQEINTKSGLRSKRDIVVLDRSCQEELDDPKKKAPVDKWGTKLSCTVWGTAAEEFSLQIGDVVVIRGCRCSQFRDAPNLSYGEQNDIITDPDDQEALNLKNWYKRIQDRVGDIPNLSTEGQSESTGGSKRIRTIAEIESDALENCVTPGVSLFYDTFAHIELMRLDDRATYMACPECNKKLTSGVSGDEYRCEKCDKYVQKPQHVYNVLVKVCDATGSVLANAF